MLEVLAGTESSLSIAQVATLASRGSRAGLTLALDRLVEHGLVIATPANRGSMYRLNRQHVLAEAVISAFQARSTLLARLSDHVANMRPKPLHVSVFGSFARREAGPESDIDLLFVLPEATDDAWHMQLAELAEIVQAWTGNRMEYLAFGEREFGGVVERGEPIVQSWIADGVTVYGMTIQAIVHRAAAQTDRAAR